MQSEILLTNDDGVQSPALEALEKVLGHLGRVAVVAPDRERSAASHCITIHEPVAYHQIAPNRFAVQGTPADCVITALMRILDEPPKIVISGINRGSNVGHDILYSGIAVSAYEFENLDFALAAQVSARIAARVLEGGLPPDVILNVNYPREWNGEFRLTRQGRRPAEPLSDYEALAAGYVSICPLQINRTAYLHLEHFTRWTELLA